MVVWSGRGILSVLVLIVSFVLGVKLFPPAYSDYAFVLAFFLAGAFSWFMGKKWNEKEGRTVIDKATGQEIVFKPNHSLFWIKMQYWAFIFGAFGLLFLVQQFV
ncbi:hypothetical protein [Flexithrix dorotheae]|uniref:hypothetical protein n=1 Tax=Flexithrix dorotheae TaxID=70993 RepID=UPI0003669120|nr:hypothetical protein [Flexithrix dorotheae]